MSEAQKVMTIQEIEKRFEGEWVAVLVTKVDRFNVPLEGIVLAQTPDHDEIWDKRHRLEGDILIMFAGDPVPEGTEVILSGDLPL